MTREAEDEDCEKELFGGRRKRVLVLVLRWVEGLGMEGRGRKDGPGGRAGPGSVLRAWFPGERAQTGGQVFI